MGLVRGMNKQRIEKIKNLADRIAECIEKSGDKKRVNALQSAKDLISFRNQIRLILKDWQKQGHEDPLSVLMITSNPHPRGLCRLDGGPDLIVIRLYEKLHSMLARTANEDDTDDSVKKVKIDEDNHWSISY